MHRLGHQFLPSPKSILFDVNRQMKSFGTKAYNFVLHVVNPCNKTMNNTQH
jgi:hypothetical protein